MGVRENKGLVRRFYEHVWDRGDVEVAHEVFHDVPTKSPAAHNCFAGPGGSGAHRG